MIGIQISFCVLCFKSTSHKNTYSKNYQDTCSDEYLFILNLRFTETLKTCLVEINYIKPFTTNYATEIILYKLLNISIVQP